MTTPTRDNALEDMEIELLLEGIHRHYGYDFRNYALSSLRRRIRDRVQAEQLRTVSGLKEKVLHDPACMERLLLSLSVNVSAMFRDPGLYRAIRSAVVPLLRTYPFIRIWHAGCSTGEEVYSMAIVLQEEGLYDRCRLYATDMNEAVLRTARAGLFPLAAMKAYTANYLQAAGTAEFSRYYTVSHDRAMFNPALKKNVVFAQHNLAMDGPFNDFHLIVCRNVMIYFDKTLRARVHALFLESLVRFGFLCLGSKETIRHTHVETEYAAFDAREKIYRRIR